MTTPNGNSLTPAPRSLQLRPRSLSSDLSERGLSCSERGAGVSELPFGVVMSGSETDCLDRRRMPRCGSIPCCGQISGAISELPRRVARECELFELCGKRDTIGLGRVDASGRRRHGIGRRRKLGIERRRGAFQLCLLYTSPSPRD